jgi:phage/plasmid primase-like uncharacterized protein
LPTAVAFDSGNLLGVAETYRARHPVRPIIIAGDNDHHLPRQLRADGRTLPNVGLEKAHAAALAVNGSVLIPQFEAGAKASDWNDHAALHGGAATRQVVAAALSERGITLVPLPRESYKVAVRPILAPDRLAARRRASEGQAPLPNDEPRADLRRAAAPRGW